MYLKYYYRDIYKCSSTISSLLLLQRLPAELSFDQITANSPTEKVREVFAAAFQAVEEAFLESIDHCIAERTQLLDKIPEDMPQLEAAHKFPDTLARLQVCCLLPHTCCNLPLYGPNSFFGLFSGHNLR